MSVGSEFFYIKDGKRQDALLHEEMLSNEKADLAGRLQTAKDTVERGLFTKAEAARAYHVKESDI
jgi:hypothetical protein